MPIDDPAGAATDWQKIAAVLPGRSNKDCRKRWFNVLSGGLRKGAWSPEEDSFLRDAVRVEGKSYVTSQSCAVAAELHVAGTPINISFCELKANRYRWMRVAQHVPQRTADRMP